jgi:hypothetical protein
MTCIADYVRYSEHEHEIRKGHEETVKNLRNRVREIFESAISPHDDVLCAGEVHLLINSQWGDIRFIDESRYEEIKTWFKNNGFRKLQILSPKIHAELMTTENAYSQWFTEREKKIENTQYRSN